MYKVSVTTLESFRRYMVEASSFDTEEKVIDSITGRFTGNDKTMFGGAYHKIIEGDFKKEGKLVVADGLTFSMQQAKPAIQYRIDHPVVSNEIPIEKIYSIPSYPEVMIRGKIDVIEGLCLRDAKCKFRYVDAREYIESCQWKLYLDMLNAKFFYYDVFEIKGFESFLPAGMFTQEEQSLTIGQDVQIVPHDPIECISYPGMLEEIQSIIVDFFDFVESRNLFVHLKLAERTESIFD